MILKKLSIKHKPYIKKFLGLKPHELSVYSFENIYIWKKLFKIYWAEIKGSLFIFFEDEAGCFLYIPPLGKHNNPALIDEVFNIMDNRNSNKNISRIENVEEKDLPFFKGLGFECAYKSCDYVHNRTDLVQLKGDKFRSKRNSFNYFVKHYEFEYLKLSPKHIDECLNLYKLWMEKRKEKSKDKVYESMLIHNKTALEALFESYRYLECTGRIVKIDEKIKAFTLGFELNADTFCILYEITDLSIKGLSQFIFRQFTGELKYKYINVMDDSELENLKQLKLSYRPERLIPSYIVKKKT